MKKEVIKAIGFFVEDEEINGEGEYGLRDIKKEKPFVYKDLSIYTKEVKGGDEGDGEEHWIVLSVTKDGEESFYKIPGWYQSYHGAELTISDTYKVTPKEKTVIVWE